MLRITAKQQLMREIVDILSVLTSEAKLVWGEKGLSISVVDGSHVALLSATIADECFETYEVEPVEIGLDLQKMRDLLTLAGPSDLVEMDYDAYHLRLIGDAVDYKFPRGSVHGHMAKFYGVDYDESKSLSFKYCGSNCLVYFI